MEKKFIKLFESVYQRYQRDGGFLVGDYVTFKKNYKSNEQYKDLTDDIKAAIDGLVDSELNLRIVDDKSYYPATIPAGPAGNGYKLMVTVAIDEGGGRYSNYVTVCPSLLDRIDTYPNLMPMSSKREIKRDVNIKPEELESDEESQANLSDTTGKGKLAFGDRKLHNKNVTLPSKSAASTTARYLKGIKG